MFAAIISNIRRAARRKGRPLLALPFLLVLGGCIQSALPLLDDKTAVADPSLTGRYHVVGIDKLPADLEVYLKGKLYLIVGDNKILFLATAHGWKNDSLLLQLRSPKKGEGAAGYTYVLLKKAPGGVLFNLIPCSGDCGLKAADDLSNFADEASANFSGPETASAEKTGELGR